MASEIRIFNIDDV